jgi:hypothetical protein
MTVINITLEEDGYYHVNGKKQEPHVSLYMIAGASKLRRMLRDSDDLIVCPGVYDGLSARIAMQLGFKALYMVCIKPHGTCKRSHTLILTTHRLAQVQRPRDSARLIWDWPSSTT